MFKIAPNKEFQMKLDTLPFSERFSILFHNNNKKKKVVYIKHEFDNSTFRYRCYNFIQALENSNKYEITYFLSEEIPEIKAYLSKIDLIVLQRANWSVEIENLIYLAKIKNIPVVFDMDDLLYKLDHVPFYMNHIGVEFNEKNISNYFNIAALYEMVIKKCDYYITTTPFLKQNIQCDFNKPTYVVPNFLNNEQIEESNYILQNRKYNPSKFVIGYFSGSASHKNDFHIVENDLIKLLDKYEDIYVKIVGYMPLEGKLKTYYQKGRIIFKKFVPYQELQYEIGSVDINIVPLVQNDFNEAKSELKFFESGIVKVPSCITPTQLYNDFIDDEKNALFCQPGEWFYKIEQLYLNRALLSNIGEEAYKTVNHLYLPKKNQEMIETVYDSILSKKHN